MRIEKRKTITGNSELFSRQMAYAILHYGFAFLAFRF